MAVADASTARYDLNVTELRRRTDDIRKAVLGHPIYSALNSLDALRTFKVDGELVGRTTGPVVTQYEVEPAPGVKVRQFANLSNDLALAMRAASIRVVSGRRNALRRSPSRCHFPSLSSR